MKSFLKSFREKYFERRDSFFILFAVYFILILFSLIAIWPILNVFSVSLRREAELFKVFLKIIPQNWTLNNYYKAFFERDLLIWLKNSLIVSLLTGVLGVSLAASAAYAFSRFNFIGKKIGILSLLLTQMFPATMLLLPTYVILTKFKLLNNFLGILVPYTATSLPFCVWLLKGYFDTIPKSLEESAYIDGCSVFKTFLKIILPLSSPALAVAALFSFMNAWTEYVIARVILTKSNMLTLPVGLMQLQGNFLTEWGIYSAAAIITSLPVVVLFAYLSKYLVSGLTIGGVKG